MKITKMYYDDDDSSSYRNRVTLLHYNWVLKKKGEQNRRNKNKIRKIMFTLKNVQRRSFQNRSYWSRLTLYPAYKRMRAML